MKRRKTYYLLLMFLLALAIGMSSATAFAAEDTISVGVSVTYGQTEARSMLDMINDFRTGSDAWVWNSDDTTKTTYTNLTNLVYDYDLEKVAMQRAAEIAIHYSHTRPNGESCWTAYGDSGVTYTAAGENIAAGYGSYTTAAQVFAGWQETDKSYSGQGHRRNMLSSDYTAVGIGHVIYNGSHFWVQEFRKPTGTAAATTANDSETTMQVEVLKSNITEASIQADQDSICIPYGESISLPTLTAKITTTETWPFGSVPVTVPCQWTTADSQIAGISDGKITGSQIGMTNITTSVTLNEEKTLTVPVTVAPVTVVDSVSSAEIQLSTDSYVYDGTAKEPAIDSVKVNGKNLTQGTDYIVSYSNNVNAGTATVTVTGKGNYTGTVTKTFTIAPKSISGVTVSGIGDKVYTGSAIMQDITVKDGDVLLVKGTDYTVSYGSNLNAGTATVTIIGNGSYVGSVPLTFTIEKKNQVITAKSYTKAYGAKVFSLGAKTDGDGKLTYKSSSTSVATVSSAGKVTIKGAGKATITITTAATANYKAAAKKVTITVNPKKASILKATASKKQMAITWKKDTKATGYQLTYALNSKFTKSKKNVTISKNTTTKKVIKKLTSKKVYYVKVRAYKKVGSQKLYGAYSSVKKVKSK